MPVLNSGSKFVTHATALTTTSDTDCYTKHTQHTTHIRKALPGDSEQFLGPLVGLATGNPFYGAIAGGIGSGVGGAVTGGGAGLLSPGLSTFGGKAGGIMELLRGSGQVVGPQGPMMPTKGIFGSGGKFGFGEGTISDAFNKYMGFGEGTGKGLSLIHI